VINTTKAIAPRPIPGPRLLAFCFSDNIADKEVHTDHSIPGELMTTQGII
jgi:hypothetical protein